MGTCRPSVGRKGELWDLKIECSEYVVESNRAALLECDSNKPRTSKNSLATTLGSSGDLFERFLCLGVLGSLDVW